MARIVLAFAVVSVVWGSTYFGIRVALESYPPFLIGAIRFIMAGALLFAWARLRGEAMPSPRQWGSAALTGILFFAVGNGLVNVAEQSVSSGLASVLVATMPLWATLFSRLFGERVSRGEVAGIVLGLAGVAVMQLGGELRASPLGTLCAVLAPMGWALGSLASRRLPLPQGTMRTASQMTTGGVVMALISLVKGEHVVAPFAPRALLAVGYLMLFGSLVGFTAYSYLLKHTRASVATSYAYVNPVIAVALGVAFAGEKLDAPSAAGTVIVLAAVALVARARQAAPQQAPQNAQPEPLAPSLVTTRP